MPRYFAFLRAINVGGHIVKMDTIRSLFEECGFSDIETYIASGNVFFSSSTDNISELIRILESHLAVRLGYQTSVFIRTAKDLSEIEKYQAFESKTDGGLYIGFLQNEPDESIKSMLLTLNSIDNQFRIHNRELYWLCQTRFSDSKITGTKLEKLLGMHITIRGLPTIQKMVQKYLSE